MGSIKFPAARSEQVGGLVPMLQERPKDKPFFFWFASSDAHRGWALNDKAPLYKPEDIEVPPYLYDGPVTRTDLAQYMHEVSVRIITWANCAPN